MTGDLTAHARDLLGREDGSAAGLWPRAVAFLARQALEDAVAQALNRRAPGAEECSARAQLLCLPTYVSTPVALSAAYHWSVLSRACHQHPYELAPTWDELTGWVEGVEQVRSKLLPAH